MLKYDSTITDLNTLNLAFGGKFPNNLSVQTTIELDQPSQHKNHIAQLICKGNLSSEQLFIALLLLNSPYLSSSITEFKGTFENVELSFNEHNASITICGSNQKKKTIQKEPLAMLCDRSDISPGCKEDELYGEWFMVQDAIDHSIAHLLSE